jgi:hypothetical protein
MKQTRRGSTYVRPTTLNPYASAYLDQQHSDPGRFKFKDQQHSDPGRFKFKGQQYSDSDRQIKTLWLSKLCCCKKGNSVKAVYPNKSSARVKLQRQSNFRYPKRTSTKVRKFNKTWFNNRKIVVK